MATFKAIFSGSVRPLAQLLVHFQFNNGAVDVDFFADTDIKSEFSM